MKKSDYEENHEKETVSRREFLAVSAALALAGISGCGSLGDTSSTGTIGAAPAQVMARAITGKMFSVAGGGQLKDGEALVFTLPNGGNPGVLLRVGEQLRAFSTKCPHAGCIVAWQKTQFQCPCHNSNFDATGKVLGGPAKTSLDKWEVSAPGDDAIITT
jgi:Rieske Fe-S protein